MPPPETGCFSFFLALVSTLVSAVNFVQLERGGTCYLSSGVASLLKLEILAFSGAKFIKRRVILPRVANKARLLARSDTGWVIASWSEGDEETSDDSGERPTREGVLYERRRPRNWYKNAPDSHAGRLPALHVYVYNLSRIDSRGNGPRATSRLSALCSARLIFQYPNEAFSSCPYVVLTMCLKNISTNTLIRAIVNVSVWLFF